jgi:alpha-tubulin suppressor-like RCC1 family protein
MGRAGVVLLSVVCATAWGAGPAVAAAPTAPPAKPEVSAGYYFSCSLAAAGTVDCWGANQWGQLGNNSTVNSRVPVPVHGAGNAGVLRGVTAISAGDDHACALLRAGTVDCWGSNSAGQLGNGQVRPDEHTFSPVPVAVKSATKVGLLSGVTAITAGSSHSCALLKAGTVDCWGHDKSGELGDDKEVSSSTPVPVRGAADVGLLSDVTAVVGGDVSTCALLAAGTVDCWGVGDRTVPLAVRGADNVGILSGVRAISGDNVSLCALLTDGTVDCFGRDSRAVPVPVPGAGNVGLLRGVTAIAAGQAATCALLVARTVDCWGYNGSGTLGDGTTVDSAVPVAVHGLHNLGVLNNVVAITAGSYHACALSTAGKITCWGSDTDGQLGNNKTVNSSVPVNVT